VIDISLLRKLIEANKGKRGFTYTHKPLTEENVSAIREANDGGFTINVSCNNMTELDELSEKYMDLPAVVIVPESYKTERFAQTEAGQKVIICPAVNRDDVTCSSCGLCQRINRKHAIGFPAHGVSKKKAEVIALA
jgi:hypothetical protein